jgi:hypothetical protein
MRTLIIWLALVVGLRASTPSREISLILDPKLGPPAQHGVAVLTEALRARGWTATPAANPNSAPGTRLIFVSRAAIPDAVKTGAFPRTGLDWPESLSVRRIDWHGKPGLVLAGGDDRGVMYATLDVAEQVTHARDDSDPLAAIRETTEQPYVRDRTLSVYTMNRAHWESRFYDERYWTRYFDLLASSRFNRFLIIFGYENGGFLAPPYPYFFDTPGFPAVHFVGLTPAQQARNLAALNRLIALAHERGIAVSLGIWDHIYRAGVQTGGAEWLDRYRGVSVPNTVEGVTTGNLNAYTLASLRELLARVPALDGLQFRIHEESGLKREEMDGFWRAVFTEMRHTRPDLLIEARAKGTPDSVIATALELGIKLRIETKYWMEQMGLPFHPTHVNPPDQQNRRHGYADLLRYPQRYEIDWRLWNGGTQRILLWGDPDYVRRYSRSTALYASPNWDVQEPLATKMEAQAPDRPTFALLPEAYRYYDYEFERYWAFFRLWGRLGYNPDAPAETWLAEFDQRFGPAGRDLADGLQRASTVLPMIVAAVYPYRLFPTTRGWAERQSLGARLQDYAKNEGTDPELFESFAAAAERIASGATTAKRTPDATSRWFDATADGILAAVAKAEAQPGATRSNEFTATVVDLKLLAQLARFHARRSLASLHFNLYQRTGHAAELRQAAREERAAVESWRALVAIAGDHYTSDLAMGARNYDLCGHWRDELVKLEDNLVQLEHEVSALPSASATEPPAWSAPARDPLAPRVSHERVLRARPGTPLRLVAHVTDPAGIESVRVRYRHVTQFEDYETLVLLPGGADGTFTGTIPGDAISPAWDFMYFIEAVNGAGVGAHWPDPLVEAPYVVVPVEHDAK